MALFKARIEWKMPRRKENKYCRSVSFLPNAIENSKKIAKKFKKENTIMVSFQAKIG